MPENTTGNSEGRDNTRPSGVTPARLRPSGVTPGRVRIDVVGWNVTFTTWTGQTYRDRADSVEMMRGGEALYTCASGRSWTAPRDWRPGDTVSVNDFNNWVVTEPWTEPRYFAGGYVAPNQMREQPPRVPQQLRLQQLQRMAAVCNCETCRQAYRQDHEQPSSDWEQRYREEMRRREQAEARAEETLRMVLKPDELAHYEEDNELVVTASDGERYRIDSGLVGNVRLLNEAGVATASLCCHPNLYPEGSGEPLPYRDGHIAQILYLRHDLDNFWKTANIQWHNNAAREAYVERQRERSRTRTADAIAAVGRATDAAARRMREFGR